MTMRLDTDSPNPFISPTTRRVTEFTHLFNKPHEILEASMDQAVREVSTCNMRISNMDKFRIRMHSKSGNTPSIVSDGCHFITRHKFKSIFDSKWNATSKTMVPYKRV